MALTPNDPQLPDGHVICFCCGETLTANQQAITFHTHSNSGSLILCRSCTPVVVGSLIQDWASIEGVFYTDYPDRRKRIFDAFDKLKEKVL